MISKVSKINPNKPNLLLIHGWGFNSSIWQYNLSILEESYNLFTLDLNGHGNTKFNKQYFDLDIYCQDIINHLSHDLALKPNNQYTFNILGWSLGGTIALNLKYKYPKYINNIILCCSNPCFLALDDWEHGVNISVWNKFSHNLLTNPSKTINEFLLLQTLNHPESKSLYKQLLSINTSSPDPCLDGLNWGLDILKQNHYSLLENIDNKNIKMILGKKDSLVPISISKHLATKHPNINQVIFERSGHMPFITEPELFYKFVMDHI